MVPDATCQVAPDWTAEHYYNIARAIVMASEYLDSSPAVLLLEAQTPGPNYDYDAGGQDGLVPVEWEPPIYDAIRLAIARGHVVVEAAGNGSENLDDARYYGSLFDRDSRDSGAIIVGAGVPPSESNPRFPEWYTNYGSRIDVQAWGNAVATTGYGDLFSGGGDFHQLYTSSFAGTSSASPLVTGAVAAILGVSLAMDGTTPEPTSIRSVLASTGTPQAPSGKLIGPQPDLRMAIGNIVAICGDAIHHSDEFCEDGNISDGDGCSADCSSDETCGNSIVDLAVGETCDDGNITAGDGCSADCSSDETCGNGYLDVLLGEMCDDGDTAGGDGCSADCSSDETCGNGVLDPEQGEHCDDGNLVDGDDCSATCHVEYATIGGGCGCGLAGAGSGGTATTALVMVMLASILVGLWRRR
jgi:cysteine-rich repeat protein